MFAASSLNSLALFMSWMRRSWMKERDHGNVHQLHVNMTPKYNQRKKHFNCKHTSTGTKTVFYLNWCANQPLFLPAVCWTVPGTGPPRTRCQGDAREPEGTAQRRTSLQVTNNIVRYRKWLDFTTYNIRHRPPAFSLWLNYAQYFRMNFTMYFSTFISVYQYF